MWKSAPVRVFLVAIAIMGFAARAMEAGPRGESAPHAAAPEAEASSHPRLPFESLNGSLRLQALLDFPAYWFYLGAPALQGQAYLPSFAPRIGPRVLWKDLGLQFTVALPIPQSERYRRGASAITDVILNSYWRQMAVDAYYQRFRGFYATSPGRELSAHRPARYPQFPDAVVNNTGFNWYYVFSPENFSLKAAFDQNEFQLVSGGSWLIMPYYNHLEMSLGSSFIPGEGDDSIQGVPNLAAGRFDTIGASYGYGYSFIRGRFFASLLGSAGPGAQYQQLNRNEGTSTHFGLAVKVNVNGALGWNSKSYVWGAQALFDSLSSNLAGTEVASNLLSGKVFFGARF